MTTRAKSFLDLDAGEQREFLTQELADWIDVGSWSLPRSTSFNRRVRILAHRVGMEGMALLDKLHADADSGRATLMDANGATA